MTHKNQGKFRLGWAWMALTVFTCWTCSSNATVLTFHLTRAGVTNDAAALNNQSFQTTITNYGNRVGSLIQANAFTLSGTNYDYHYEQGNGFTTNVQVRLFAQPTSNPRYYVDGVWTGGVNYLSAQASNPRLFYYEFNPDDDFGVQINSFNLLTYPNPANPNFQVAWNVRIGATNGASLLSGTNTFTSIPFTNVFVSLNNASSMNTLVLEISQLNGSSGYLGLDNLNFDQIVPEPSAGFLMLFSGVAAIFMRRNREKCCGR